MTQQIEVLHCISNVFDFLGPCQEMCYKQLTDCDSAYQKMEWLKLIKTDRKWKVCYCYT